MVKKAKKTAAAGPRRDWTEAELKNMKKQNTKARVIAMKLKRTVTSIYGKAAPHIEAS